MAELAAETEPATRPTLVQHRALKLALLEAALRAVVVLVVAVLAVVAVAVASR